ATPPPRKLPAEVVKVLSEVNETRGALRDAWRWIGAKAARTGGVHDLVRSHVPQIYCDDFDTGARGAHARWPRPFDDAFEKRATRAFESLTRKQQKDAIVKEAKELIEIVSLVRRTEGRGRGAKIDLELRVGEETYALSGLDTKELGSYAAIRARAMGEGALLPDLEKEARSVWRDKLAEGWARMRTEVVREGTTHRALVDAIRETLRMARAGRSQSDFLRGHVIRLSDERVAIVASELMIRARTKVLPDMVSREQVLDAARELGVDSDARPVFPDGSRMRAWTFPARVLDPDD
ncbi:MAG: hypothetical protein KIT58_21930, partial [Planctomycetota bacterium]|nr:hypothetical protein [Planctomycetota bacterium]